MSRSGLTLVTGGSGFIGSHILLSSPVPVRALVHNNEVGGVVQERIYGSLLDSNTNFDKWLDGVVRVIHAARPSAGRSIRRYQIGKRTRGSAISMLEALEGSEVGSITVVHGSLSYGDRGNEMVGIDSALAPKGYAKAYSIGEKPWLDFLGDGGSIHVVRAPWVLGPGSWFSMLYSGDTIPVIEGGENWMSIISVDSLADYLWSLDGAEAGVMHPPLTCRCRQVDFARALARVRGCETTSVTSSQVIRRFGKMAAESILCSVRMDDGRGLESEGESAMRMMEDYLLSIESGSSNT